MSLKAIDQPMKQLPWINPIGGLGDMLMVSGVLKLVHDQDPAPRFNLVRRTRYTSLFQGHPAIARIDYVPKDATIMGVDYWSMEPLGPGDHRPFQILARAFGLATPVAERLFLPVAANDDAILHAFIPWKKRNILIAPGSDSPRKMMDLEVWRQLVEQLEDEDTLVIQVGRQGETYIKKAYSLIGLTTPKELLAVVKNCDLVITLDNFIMHAAHLVGTDAVVIWGPTHHQVYGYSEQVHLQCPKRCGLGELEECIGPSVGPEGKICAPYNAPCAHGDKHCLKHISWEMIITAMKNLIS
jgi:ADP-heptose:LPS heptosyltransferase